MEKTGLDLEREKLEKQAFEDSLKRIKKLSKAVAGTNVYVIVHVTEDIKV